MVSDLDRQPKFPLLRLDREQRFARDFARPQGQRFVRDSARQPGGPFARNFVQLREPRLYLPSCLRTKAIVRNLARRQVFDRDLPGNLEPDSPVRNLLHQGESFHDSPENQEAYPLLRRPARQQESARDLPDNRAVRLIVLNLLVRSAMLEHLQLEVLATCQPVSQPMLLPVRTAPSWAA